MEQKSPPSMISLTPHMVNQQSTHHNSHVELSPIHQRERPFVDIQKQQLQQSAAQKQKTVANSNSQRIQRQANRRTIQMTLNSQDEIEQRVGEVSDTRNELNRNDSLTYRKTPTHPSQVQQHYYCQNPENGKMIHQSELIQQLNTAPLAASSFESSQQQMMQRDSTSNAFQIQSRQGAEYCSQIGDNFGPPHMAQNRRLQIQPIAITHRSQQILSPPAEYDHNEGEQKQLLGEVTARRPSYHPQSPASRVTGINELEPLHVQEHQQFTGPYSTISQHSPHPQHSSSYQMIKQQHYQQLQQPQTPMTPNDSLLSSHPHYHQPASTGTSTGGGFPVLIGGNTPHQHPQQQHYESASSQPQCQRQQTNNQMVVRTVVSGSCNDDISLRQPPSSSHSYSDASQLHPHNFLSPPTQASQSNNPQQYTQSEQQFNQYLRPQSTIVRQDGGTNFDLRSSETSIEATNLSTFTPILQQHHHPQAHPQSRQQHQSEHQHHQPLSQQQSYISRHHQQVQQLAGPLGNTLPGNVQISQQQQHGGRPSALGVMLDDHSTHSLTSGSGSHHQLTSVQSQPAPAGLGTVQQQPRVYMLHQQRQPIHMSHSVVTQNRRFSQQHPQQVQQQLQASGSSTFMMNAPPLPQDSGRPAEIYVGSQRFAQNYAFELSSCSSDGKLPVSTAKIEPKERYRDLKRKFKFLVYENEYYQEELRNLQRKLLKLSRDKNFLLDRLLPYEQLSESSDESDASAKTLDEKGNVPIKKRKAASSMRQSGDRQASSLNLKQPNTSGTSAASRKRANATGTPTIAESSTSQFQQGTVASGCSRNRGTGAARGGIKGGRGRGRGAISTSLIATPIVPSSPSLSQLAGQDSDNHQFEEEGSNSELKSGQEVLSTKQHQDVPVGSCDREESSLSSERIENERFTESQKDTSLFVTDTESSSMERKEVKIDPQEDKSMKEETTEPSATEEFLILHNAQEELEKSKLGTETSVKSPEFNEFDKKRTSGNGKDADCEEKIGDSNAKTATKEKNGQKESIQQLPTSE